LLANNDGFGIAKDNCRKIFGVNFQDSNVVGWVGTN
jgi:hypothetical protein